MPPLSYINWGSVADWVSGIGSLSAAIVALYLARWSQRIRLTGYCGLRVAIGGEGPKQELVFVSVTNVGTRATVIVNLSMRVGRWKKRYAIIPLPRDQYSVGLPYTLADGQQGNWAMPLDEKKTWLREVCDGFIMSKADVKTLVFQLHTSHGETLTLRPEQPLKNAMFAILGERGA